jgi:hypothetical protein
MTLFYRFYKMYRAHGRTIIEALRRRLIKVVDTKSMPKINNYGMVLVNA